MNLSDSIRLIVAYSRCVLQALKEIRNLVVQSDSLEEKKRVLTQMQSTHVKRVAHLSGAFERAQGLMFLLAWWGY